MKKITTLIILLFSIFSVSFEDTQSYVPEYIDLGDPNIDKKNIGYSASFLLGYSPENIQNLKEYFKVTVTSQKEKNQYVYLANSQECTTERKLLGMQPYGSIYLIINKKELTLGQSLYLCVQCLETPCYYDLKIDNEINPKLKIGEQYSYYVNYTNRDTIFEIEIDKNTASTFDNTFYNIWVKGENIASSIEGFTTNKVEFSHGHIYSIKYEGNRDSYKLYARGETGDYITIGSIEIKNGIASPLRINDNEILGVISKTQGNNEICFGKKIDSAITSNEVVYINGIVFTKKLKTYYKSGTAIDDFSDKNITDGNIIEGIYYEDYINETKLYCAGFVDDDQNQNVVFSLQLSSNNHKAYSQIIYPPQYPGVIYPHFLLKDEIAVFQGMKPRDGATEINFNMKALVGFPDMLYDSCQTYPDCFYDDEKLNDVVDPHHSNRMSVYSFYLKDEKEITPISAFQPLMIVKCREGTKHKERTNEYCIFETAIFTNKDRLILKETETFTQLLLKKESDLYRIEFEQETGVKKIYLDLIVFSGDVRFKIDDSYVEQKANKYFLANKIFYSITIDAKINSKIDFSVIAEKNSFYVISYQLVKDGEENLNIRESGVNFVESIAIDDDYIDQQKPLTKIVYLQNTRSDVGCPFLASFYSKNCAFYITRYDDPDHQVLIDRFGDFAQVIIDENDDHYYQDRYAFKIEVLADDESMYDKKLCMFYVSGLELEKENTGGQRSISLSEGVPHSYIFAPNYTSISYSYHISDIENPVVIDFNLIDKDTFKVEILFNYFSFKNFTIFRNQQIFIYSNELKNRCEKDEVCTVNIFIRLNDTNSTKVKRIETTISQVEGAPIYLSKNALRQDFLIGDKRKYFYLDIGSGESGDITVNYKRSSGNIYAKIVKRDELAQADNADWRGIYNFPKTMENTLRYETYLKKIIIQPENTIDCDQGCYVLITVQSSNLRDVNYTDEKDALIPYRMTITPRIIKSGFQNYNELPPVVIPLNEYIIGNIEALNEGNLYYFYYVMLPFESEYLMIDWQADSPSLLVNCGPEKPSIENNDFNFNKTHHDTVFTIKKTDLIEKCRAHGVPADEKMKFLNLSLAVYTKKIDTIYTSIYAFKLFQPPNYIPNPQLDDQQKIREKEAFELIHIRADQKVQCDPGENLVCLFAVIFDDGDISSNLVVHPKAHDDGVEVTFMGDLVNSTEIERNNIAFIVEQMALLEGKYHSNERNYIYYENIPKDKCLLFLVQVDRPSIIDVLTSTSKDYYFVPNPSTAQIFSLPAQKQLYLNFQTTQDLLINIVCVSGEGFFHWEEEDRKYHLLGYEDRITLTSGTSNYDNLLTHLVAEANQYQWNKRDNSGFVFYITYYPRNPEYNMDQVKPGRSTEFNYRDIKFPLNFFTPLNEKDIAVSFNFYNFYSQNPGVKSFQYSGPLFKIKAAIITDEEAYYARIDKENKPILGNDSVVGVCDGPFGNLYMSYDEVESYKYYDKNKNYSLYFTVEMGASLPFDFNGASLELSISREQTSLDRKLFEPENVYLNGKLGNNELINMHYFRHRLKTDINNPYMLIEFAANSKEIGWFVSTQEFANSTDKNKTEFTDFEEQEIIERNGKVTFMFRAPIEKVTNNSLYLIVFNENGNSENRIDPRLCNYVFKYMNAISKDNLFNIYLKNSTVELNKVEKDYRLSFERALDVSDSEYLTYYVKAIYNESIIKGEKMDTIAISESNGTYLQAFNTTSSDNNRVFLTLKNVDKEVACIKVLAKGTSNAINIYSLYDVVSVNGYKCVEKADEEQKPSGNNTGGGDGRGGRSGRGGRVTPGLVVLIAILVTLVVAAIIIVVFVFFFNQKNKDLMEKVNTISFSDEDQNKNLLANTDNSIQ